MTAEDRKRPNADLMSVRAKRRAARRMQKIIEDGTPDEALAAYKLLYGQPPSKKGKRTLPPSAREAPGVSLPVPTEILSMTA